MGVDMSDLTGQSMLNDICLGGCGNERRTTLSAKRLRVLEYAQKTGNVRKACRYFGIGRSSFYRWKRAFDQEGESGLANKPRETGTRYTHALSENVSRPDCAYWFYCKFRSNSDTSSSKTANVS